MSSKELNTTGQDIFFRKLGQVFSSKKEMAAAMTNVLNITMDSAYRRIRGSNALTYDEFVQLDRVFLKNSLETVPFVHHQLNSSIASFGSMLDAMIGEMEKVAQNNKLKLRSHQKTYLFS